MRAPRPEPGRRATVTTDADGIVTEFKPPSKKQSDRERLEKMLARRIDEAGLPTPIREHRFAQSEGRQWRFDFAWVGAKVACEVEGGIWAPMPGRHNRGSGMEEDCRKYNTAALLGWIVIRVTERLIKSGEAVDVIKRALTSASCDACQPSLTEYNDGLETHKVRRCANSSDRGLEGIEASMQTQRYHAPGAP